MASGRRGRSDITLGAGHVAGIFLGFVLLCGIFFTLGYVMGRGHSSSGPASPGRARRAPVVDANGDLTGKAGGAPPTGWDFYPKKSRSAKGSSGSPLPGLTPEASARPHPVSVPPPPRSGPVAMERKPRNVRVDPKPPVLTHGRAGIALQVAAFNNRADALSMAGFLKKKGYPAFAWGPGSDHLYRVQVGPYASESAAQAVKLRLQREGFKSILKKSK
jgi:cell division septation protein DedD